MIGQATSWCTEFTSMKGHYQIIIIGGGNAGISVAAQLLRKERVDLVIVDPATHHYYQPAWTLVGGGAMTSTKQYAPRLK